MFVHDVFVKTRTLVNTEKAVDSAGNAANHTADDSTNCTANGAGGSISIVCSIGGAVSSTTDKAL